MACVFSNSLQFVSKVSFVKALKPSRIRQSIVFVNPREKQMEIGREGTLLESWITRRFIIFQTKIGGPRTGVNNHSLPARFREKMQNLAGRVRTALHRVSGLVIYRNSCGQPRFESSPVTFAENFHLVIGARVNATTVITITPRYPITLASFFFRLSVFTLVPSTGSFSPRLLLSRRYVPTGTRSSFQAQFVFAPFPSREPIRRRGSNCSRDRALIVGV